MLMYIHHNFGLLQLVFILVFIIGGAIAGVARLRMSRQRYADLQALADRLGFDSFDPAPDPEFVEAWGLLDQFSQGNDRYAFNILRGTYQEQKLFIFDYHYETGSGKDRHDHVSTIFMLVLKEAFPRITIGPENLFAKIEGIFDKEDVKFESAEFSRAFRVHCPDKKFAYDVCNPQMIDYLLANRGFEIEIQGPVISLVFKPQLPVDQIEPNLQRLGQFRALLPQYLFTT